MPRLSIALLLTCLATLAPALCRAGPSEDTADAITCDLPADVTTPDTPLPHFAAALTSGKPVHILAVGSGSTVGDATGNAGPAFVFSRPNASFPHQMVDSLRADRPTTLFDLTVKGARNMTAADMLGLLQEALSKQHFDLVVWQTGTVEAVRGLRPETMRDVLQIGIDAAEQSGADVVIVDPQFSRFLRANTDIGPYESALQQVAAITSAALFRRFDLTEAWATSGQIDLETASRSTRDHTITELNTCLGRALAAFVLAGAAAAH
jgi:hypothetical protein